ncbi:MAG: hypothetical protein OEZ32_13270, partial [Nitrospinota bacterium]|nr:hypothetical protein [Nitrospinota bacterium]
VAALAGVCEIASKMKACKATKMRMLPPRIMYMAPPVSLAGSYRYTHGLRKKMGGGDPPPEKIMNT